MDSLVTAVLELVVVTGFVLVDGLLLASVVVVAVFMWRRLSGRRAAGGTPPVHSSRQIALRILEERYQRGEIDAAELEGRRALLHRER
jgi:uncharacterized membrane protein